MLIEKVIDHYERPRNVGSLPKNDIDVGTGLYVTPLYSLISICFLDDTDLWDVELVHRLVVM